MRPIVIILSPLLSRTALKVAWGLRANGVRVLCASALADAGSGPVSIALERGDCAVHAAFGAAAVRSVWCYRPQAPALPPDIPPARVAAARSEWLQFETDLRELGPQALATLWVNEPRRARDAESPLLQLRTAQRVGLAVPATLVSSDPARIRDFVARHGRVACRAFLSHSAAAEPVVLEHADAIDATAAARQPRIYQRCIEAAGNVRVAVVGESRFAARLADRAQPYELPARVQIQLAALMRELGIVHGCIDLQLDAHGQLHFAGVEPRSHGLGLEELVPELPILKALCAMLAQGRTDYVLDLAADVSVAQWRDSGRSHEHAPRPGAMIAPPGPATA